MPNPEATDLIKHLTRMSALSEDQAAQLVEEVLAYLNEDLETFIRRRHHEMQQHGLSNAKIFAAIQSELSGRLFPAKQFSERKIRRVIYG